MPTRVSATSDIKADGVVGQVLTSNGPSTLPSWQDSNGGKYRQFTYIVSGGDFSFIIDDQGNPVMALQELE